MAGPFANPWQYAAEERHVGRRLRWCMVNTCHNRIVSTHDTCAEARTAIADRLAFLKALNDLRAYCKGDKTPVFVLPLPSCDGQFSLHFPTPEETSMKRSTTKPVLKPVAKPSQKTAPPSAVKVDTIAQLRSEAARKAWATRRAQNWTHPSAAPKPAPIAPPSPVTRKRVAARQFVRA